MIFRDALIPWHTYQNVVNQILLRTQQLNQINELVDQLDGATPSLVHPQS